MSKLLILRIDYPWAKLTFIFVFELLCLEANDLKLCERLVFFRDTSNFVFDFDLDARID